MIVHFGYTLYRMRLDFVEGSATYTLLWDGQPVATTELPIKSERNANAKMTFRLAVYECVEALSNSRDERVPAAAVNEKHLHQLLIASGLINHKAQEEIWAEIAFGITDHDLDLAWPHAVKFFGYPTQAIETEFDLTKSIPDILMHGEVELRVFPWPIQSDNGPVWLARRSNRSEQYLVRVKETHHVDH